MTTDTAKPPSLIAQVTAAHKAQVAAHHAVTDTVVQKAQIDFQTIRASLEAAAKIQLDSATEARQQAIFALQGMVQEKVSAEDAALTAVLEAQANLKKARGETQEASSQCKQTSKTLSQIFNQVTKDAMALTRAKQAEARKEAVDAITAAKQREAAAKKAARADKLAAYLATAKYDVLVVANISKCVATGLAAIPLALVKAANEAFMAGYSRDAGPKMPELAMRLLPLETVEAASAPKTPESPQPSM